MKALNKYSDLELAQLITQESQKLKTADHNMTVLDMELNRRLVELDKESPVEPEGGKEDGTKKVE